MKRKEFIEHWLKALESEEYRQTRGVLKAELKGGEYAYCCLGVACEVANDLGVRKVKIVTDKEQVLPPKMTSLIGISENGSFVEFVEINGGVYSNLAEMNDDWVSFKKIAQVIREQLAAGNFEKP